MKALFALCATVSFLPGVALAQQMIAIETPAEVSITTCSISSDNSSTSASFDLSGAGTIGGIAGGVIAGRTTARITTTPSSNGGSPTVTAHAIRTKGAGSNDRAALPNNKHPELMRTYMTVCAQAEHSIKNKGAGSQDRIAATAGMQTQNPNGQVSDNSPMSAPRATCSISANGTSISVSHLQLPSSSKVSTQDLQFVSSKDAMATATGLGGLPSVLARCNGADGAPSEVTMLLLPAVQK